jgi:hypothetical protein
MNPCACATPDANVVQVYNQYSQFGPVIHNSPAFWEDDVHTQPSTNYVYLAGSAPLRGHLVQYELCPNPTSGVICGTPLNATDPTGTNPILFSYGTTPSISASQPETAGDAIVWAINKTDANCPQSNLTCPPNTHPISVGVFYAFDALSMKQLYASSTCPNRDSVNQATKFSVPTVANSYVYLGTQSANTNQQNTGQGTFYIFGLNAGTCQ